MYRNPKYLYGDDENLLVPSHINFGKYVLSHLLKKNDEIAMDYKTYGTQITYREVTDYAISMCIKLTSLGIGKGDVVLFGAENRKEFMPAVFGIIMTGATYSGLSANPGKANILHVFNVTKANRLVCTSKFWSTNKEVIETIEGIETIVSIDSDDDADDDKIIKFKAEDVNRDDFEPAEVNGQNDVAVILFSSGTTGLPKGVLLTHLNCITSSDIQLFSDESLHTAFIMGHCQHNYDFFMAVKFMLLGRKLVCEENPVQAFYNFDDWKVDICFITPTVLNLITKDDKWDSTESDNLKIIYCRSFVLHSEIAEKVNQKMPKLRMLAVGFGMTECGEPTSWLWSKNEPKFGSCGKVAPGIILKVVDVSTENPLGPNDKGELCVKGPQLMKGYIDIDPTTYLDAEGFYKTGDLGYYDEDGNVFIIDRLKDIIVNHGFKISPQFIENVVIKHPAVLEVAVIGKPDPVSAELPMAFIVKKPGFDVTEEEIHDFMRPQVSVLEMLTGGIRFLEKLPRNTRGKVLRRELRTMI